MTAPIDSERIRSWCWMAFAITGSMPASWRAMSILIEGGRRA